MGVHAGQHDYATNPLNIGRETPAFLPVWFPMQN